MNWDLESRSINMMIKFVALFIKFYGLHPLLAWQRGYKTFSNSTQLSMKFFMLINVTMPTIVCILTFISMIYATSESFKSKEVFIFQYFSFKEQFNFHS